MKADIRRYCVKICKKYKLNCTYVDNDVYVIHKRGRAVQNFNSSNFYKLPKRARERMFLPLVNVGMRRNLDTIKDQVLLNIKMGKKIA